MTKLELPHNLKINSKIRVNHKSSDTIISPQRLNNTSFFNEFYSTIENIEIGKIVTVLSLKNDIGEMESTIPREIYKKLTLKNDINVYYYVNTASIFIDKIYD